MKILQVTPFYEPDFRHGGVIHSTRVLARTLVEQGHEVTVLATRHPSDIAAHPIDPDYDYGGVEVIRSRPVLKGFGFGSEMIRAAAQVQHFDVVHIASFWQLHGLPVQLAALRYGVPCVVSARGSLYRVVDRSPATLKHRGFFRLAIRPALQHVSAIHVTADVERADLAALRLRPPSFKVPNPFVTEKYASQPTSADGRARFSLPADAAIMLYLGRLDARKGIDLLIQGLHGIRDLQPEATLVIAGPDHGAESELRALAERLELGERVRFTGLVDAEGRAALFAAADLCALTPYGGENFGNAAAEALAAALPVLLSDHVGMGEYVDHHGAGLVVAAEASRVTEALAQLLSDRAELARMGSCGPGLVAKHYDAPAVTRLMVRAYTDLIESTRSEECGWQDTRV